MSVHDQLVAALRAVIAEGDDPESAFFDAMREIEPPVERSPGRPATMASVAAASVAGRDAFAAALDAPSGFAARFLKD